MSIEKTNQAGVKLRVILFIVFIIASVIMAVCFTKSDSDKDSKATLAFWPPDMVPHPPHFPDPTPPPNGPVMS